METYIPIYRAKKIDSDECIEGFYYKSKAGYTREYHAILRGSIEYDESIAPDSIFEIDPSTLEISDGKKWRKLNECNFRTDEELDKHLYDGFKDGYNNCTREKDGMPNFKTPYDVAKQMKSISDEVKVTGIQQ